MQREPMLAANVTLAKKKNKAQIRLPYTYRTRPFRIRFIATAEEPRQRVLCHCHIEGFGLSAVLPEGCFFFPPPFLSEFDGGLV